MIDEFYQLNPYALDGPEKSRMLTKELTELTRFHQERCPEYANFLRMLGYDEGAVRTPADIPFFPVRMFKEFDLLSIGRNDVFKTMTSSGTTGQRVSKIFVDKATAMSQQKVMLKILGDFWGKGRFPMLVVDTPAVLKDRKSFSARGAAILGLQFAAREMVFVLNDDMTLNVEKLRAFLEKYQGRRFIVFGFTFLVWRHFYQELLRLEERFDFSEAFLMTGGGWKKLTAEAVSQAEFKRRLQEVCGLRHFLDHYGMVEQTGAIYAECECGHLHASIYSDVIIRDYRDFSPCPVGQPGIVQVVSVLPHSYPGHSLLTEDEGVVLGEDDCPCGRKGKYIQILGRMKSAELRGCSDTYGAEFDKLTFLVGDLERLRQMSETPVLPAFSDRAVTFLSQLSRMLLRDKRSGVDVKSYAYWIRRASLEAASREGDYRNRLGRGVALHIAPSNVPVNFAVSMTSSLLAGNCTVIRVSSKPFPQVDLICEAINALLDGACADMRPYLCILRHEHSPEITQALSNLCDLRVIWGGDRTIETIRQAALPPRAVEMAFADRFSIAVIDADVYLESDPEKTAKDFYTDTYYTDQNACSSPRLVVWLGNAVEEARERFWTTLERLVQRDYPMQPIQAVDKYSAVCALGMSRPGVRCVSGSTFLMRAEVDRLTADVMDYKCGGGCFFEYIAKDLDEIAPVLTKRCQTVAVLGVEREQVRELVFSSGVRGVDRIVPLGGTMELSFIWDGFKMVESMSRYVYG